MSNSIIQPVADISIPIMLFDGGSIGNPPKTAAAAILLMPNGRRYTVSHFLFLATDIEAQYTGLIIGLRKARQLNIKLIEVKGSGLWIASYPENGQQMQNHEILRLLYREVQLLMQSFAKISLEWIPAEQNRSATTAVNRCIGETFSLEFKQNNKEDTRKISPAIINFKRLGKDASLEDYELLKAEIDDLTFKPLAQLELLVTKNINQTLTSQWKGNTLDISEAYRWYLRGLPLEMALRKAFLDAELATQKLSQNSNILSPPTINIETTLYERPISQVDKDLPLIEIVDENTSNTKTYFSPGYIDFDGAGINEKETYVCNSDLEWALGNAEQKDTLTSPGIPLNALNSSIASPVVDNNDDNYLDLEPIKPQRRDRVKDILDSISRLNLEEKTYLSQEILNSPELVYLILKVMADKLT